MPDETRHIIEHADGRSYSVTKAGFKAAGYEDEGFKIVRPEATGDFLVSVPAPKAPRSRPRSKASRQHPKPAAPVGTAQATDAEAGDGSDGG